MRRPELFAPEAEQDIAEAYNWYEGRRLARLCIIRIIGSDHKIKAYVVSTITQLA